MFFNNYPWLVGIEATCFSQSCTENLFHEEEVQGWKATSMKESTWASRWKMKIPRWSRSMSTGALSSLTVLSPTIQAEISTAVELTIPLPSVRGMRMRVTRHKWGSPEFRSRWALLWVPMAWHTWRHKGVASLQCKQFRRCILDQLLVWASQVVSGAW